MLVKFSFNDGVRITLPQLLKWCSQAEEVKTYFNYFRMDGPEMKSVKPLSDQQFLNFENYQQQILVLEEQDQRPGEKLKPVNKERFISKTSHQLITNRRQKNFRAWLSTALQPIIAFRIAEREKGLYQKIPEEMKVKLEWVYGIRSSDTRNALQYTAGCISAVSQNTDPDDYRDIYKNEEEIVYYIAAVVVLLNTNVSKQRFYLSHQNEVISVAVSTIDGLYIASGELAPAPSIHIWSRKTLETINVLKGEHSEGVHLLAFTYDNRQIVTCGITNPSAVIIYDWRTGQALLSASVHSPTQQIFIMHQIQSDKVVGDYQVFEDEELIKPPPTSGVVVLSLNEMCVFTPKDNSFAYAVLSLEECCEEVELYEPMCGLSIIANSQNMWFDALQVNSQGQRHILLTGHKNGFVLLWRNDCYLGVLTDFQEEVSTMCLSIQGLVICTWSGKIHFWDPNLTGPIRTIEMQSLPFKLLNYNISSLDYNQNRLLLLTIAGDAVEITMIDSDGALSIKAKRINSITKISGLQKAMVVLNQSEQVVMIGGDDGLVISYDVVTHTMIDVWAIGSKVTALTNLPLEQGFLTAAGTSNGNVVIRSDWEETTPRYNLCGTKAINDLQFSRNGLVLAAASNDKTIYIFHYSDGEFIKGEAQKLENGIPVSINFSEDSKMIVICTNQRKLLLLDPITKQLFFRAEDLTLHLWSNWVGRYPLNSKSQTTNFIPICLGNEINIVASGDENGNLYIWRDTESIKEHFGVNLSGHSSSIQRICITQDDKRLLSLGHNDQCILQWKLALVESQPNRERGVNIKQYQQENEGDLSSKIFVTDESLVNEINFCFVSSLAEADTDVTEQSIADNAVLIRGCNNQVINRLGTKLNFEFEEQIWKRPPPVALVLDHIYGVQTSDRRHTVLYMHFHGDKPQEQMPKNTSITAQLGIIGANNSRLDQVLPKLLGPNFQQLLDPNKQIKYDQVHQTCHKHLIYFTSRFGIIYSPTKKVQQFYTGHSVKISCIQKHPSRRLIATGEVSLQPTIHIWDTQTLEPLMVLETSHRGGILHLAFSPDGQKLISIGMDRVFSIQVFQWEQNRTIAFRNLGFYPVFALKFFPFENSRFITCGYQHLAIWRLRGNHLSCQQFQKYESQKINVEVLGEPLRSVLISVDFLNYRLGHEIQSDVLFGTSQGEITTYCSGKHFVLNENAHKGSVNCLKVTDKIHDSINVITGGEDGLIKIWDTSIKLLQSIDVRDIPQVMKDFKNQRCYGIQSIEMYCCDKQQPKRLIVGLRFGEIFEAIISDKSSKQELQTTQKLPGQSSLGVIGGEQSATLNFEFFTIVSAHSSLAGSQGQKKIQCAMNPELPILASVSDDETLRFWDIIKKQVIISKNLGTQATAIAFSPEGSFLVIGLVNGVMLVIDSKIQKLSYGTYMEEYTIPTLDIVMSPKEAKAAIVCMKFSYRGDYLAVSFNNEYRDEQAFKKNLNSTGIQIQDNTIKTEPSFVLIYVNRLSQKNPGVKLNSNDPYVKIIRVVIPLYDFQSSASIRKQLAVTSMDFSDCDNYLQLSIQQINQECIIDTQTYDFGANNIFLLWDITNNQLFQNIESLKNVSWPEWSMAAAINARFQGTDINVEDMIEERQLLFRELCFMSKISKFSLQPIAICGSHQGGLYTFRFDALTIDKLKVTDFKFDLVKKSEMSASRCFQGHTSMIQQIEIFQDKIVMSTSVSDQSIVQWRVEYEDKHWELDYNYIEIEAQLTGMQPQQPADPYFEFLTKAQFDQLQTEVWSQRLRVSEINQGIDKKEYENPACELELQYVIGRRAFDRRMNIKIDCMDRITYNASSLQVFLTENDEQDEALRYEGITSEIKQSFLRPDGNKFKSVSPELSTFCLSKDQRLLFVATAQTNANVFIWEVTTNMKLGEFTVQNVPVITNIKVANDTKHILILGITKEYYQIMTMVDWTKDNKILFTRQFLHSITCKIREIEFMPNLTLSFITAGIQHLCFWKLSGNNLEYQVGELTIPRTFASNGKGALNPNAGKNGQYGMALVSEMYAKDFYKEKSKNQQDDDLENLLVTFLNVVFVSETLLTGGDDGYLYLWEGFRIVRRIFAHEGAIYALHSNSKLGLIVSGGIEGVVILWRIFQELKSNVRTIEKLKVYNLRKNIQSAQIAVANPECNIQSICLGFNRIIVGMRTGSIYEVVISEDRKIIKPHHDASNDPVKRWLKCTDHQQPKCVGIDMIASRIFTLTLQGLLTIWDLKTFDIIYQKDYVKISKFLLTFRLSNLVCLVFEHDIHVLDSDPKSKIFVEKPEYNLVLNLITYATLNQDEQILGVATVSAAQPEVTLYATEGGFIKIKQIFGFKSTIRFLDFSSDNFFMQVEDQIGDVQLYELENDKVLPKDIVFELEWLGEGLRSYSQVKGIKLQYNNNNKIGSIKKLLGKPIIIVADELGTIRLFNYPNIKGEAYYQSYTDHLFIISDCKFSPDGQFFISSCEMDKCVFKWKLKLNNDKIAEMQDDYLKNTLGVAQQDESEEVEEQLSYQSRRSNLKSSLRNSRQ